MAILDFQSLFRPVRSVLIDGPEFRRVPVQYWAAVQAKHSLDVVEVDSDCLAD